MGDEILYGDMGLYLAKQESTRGVDSTPTYADNVIYCLESSMKMVVNMIDMTRKKHAFTSPGGLVGKKWCEHTFKMPLCGAWDRPLYKDVPIPDFDVLLKSSNHERTDTTTTRYVAETKAAAVGPTYDISGGATIVYAVDGGSDQTATLDHGNATKYPTNTAATIAQIIADVGAHFTSNGATLFALNGLLGVRSNTTTSSASIRIQAATADIFGFTEGATVTAVQERRVSFKSGNSQYFDISSGAVIAFVVNGGSTVTLTLDHNNVSKYPSNTRATAAQIVADVGSTAYAAGVTITAYRGFLWLLNNDFLTGATLEMHSTSSAIFGFTEGAAATAAPLVIKRTYKPTSFNATPTCTVYGQIFTSGGKANGKTYRLKSFGCVFNVEFSISTEGECFINFTGKGTYEDPIDVDFPTGVAIKNMTDGMVGIGATIDIDARDGNAARCDCLSEFTLQPSWDVQEIPCACAEDGIEAFFLTRKTSIKFSMNPLARLVATYDRWALVKNANANSIEISLTSPQGSVVGLRILNAQLGSPELQWDGTIRYNQQGYVRDVGVDADDQYYLDFSCVET